jgi:hypothetical protein
MVRLSSVVFLVVVDVNPPVNIRERKCSFLAVVEVGREQHPARRRVPFIARESERARSHTSIAPEAAAVAGVVDHCDFLHF